MSIEDSLERRRTDTLPIRLPRVLATYPASPQLQSALMGDFDSGSMAIRGFNDAR